MTEPSTPALDAIAVAGTAHRVVRTERASSAEESARFQGIETRQLLRTIVVRRGDDDYLFVLVPAGRRFDWPKLRELLGVRRMTLPDADEARAVTGYERYTITPFGSRSSIGPPRFLITPDPIISRPLVNLQPNLKYCFNHLPISNPQHKKHWSALDRPMSPSRHYKIPSVKTCPPFE